MVGGEVVGAVSADAVGDVEGIKVFAERVESSVQFLRDIDFVGYWGVVDVLL